MIIDDLNHLVTVSEDQNIEGAGYYILPYASAKAYAGAVAVGYISSSKTYTNTEAVAGVFSSSTSGSSSVAIG